MNFIDPLEENKASLGNMLKCNPYPFLDSLLMIYLIFNLLLHVACENHVYLCSSFSKGARKKLKMFPKQVLLITENNNILFRYHGTSLQVPNLHLAHVFTTMQAFTQHR